MKEENQDLNKNRSRDKAVRGRLMRVYDAKVTEEFFEKIFPSESQPPLTARDQIFIKYILANCDKTISILDYGCGHGSLVSYLNKNGFNVYGMERSAGMRGDSESNSIANEKDKIIEGGIDQLKQITDHSLDLVIAMGVFQYLEQSEYVETITNIHRVLKKDGLLVATFQNAFFDLFTFNKFTIDFFVNELLDEFISESDAEEIQQQLAKLITSYRAPTYSKKTARDNIYVRLTNPLTIDSEMSSLGFLINDKYFYEFFGLPPLMVEGNRQIADRIKKHLEIDRASDWRGHFMANAFLVAAKKM